MDQIHRLLQESIFCYRKLLEVYEHLREKMTTGGSSIKLNALLDQSRELNKVIQCVDGQCRKMAADNQVVLEDLPQFSEWKSLMVQVREKNRHMRRHLKLNMAILSDDIHRLGRTKKAISGYRSVNDNKGRQINIFSA
jgi:hypothetical protein